MTARLAAISEQPRFSRVALVGWVACLAAGPAAGADKTVPTPTTSGPPSAITTSPPFTSAEAALLPIDDSITPVPARQAPVPPWIQDLTAVPIEGVRAGKWNFSAGAAGTLTLTDNVNLAPSGQAESDLVLGLSAPLGVRRATPRMKLFAEYIPTFYIYARNGQSDNLQNNLRSFVSVEAIDDYFFVDAIANSYQTYVSPFQSRPQSGSSISANRTQQATFGVSPYVRHETTRGWAYLLRSDNFWNAYSGTGLADTFLTRVTGIADAPPTRVSYGLDYTYLYTSGAGQSDPNYQQVARLRPIFRPTRTLNLGARLGYETNDYDGPYSGGVYGAGLQWVPNPRTALDGFLEHRFFGASYGLNFNHRSRRTVWRLNGTRNTYTTIEQPLTLRPSTTAELLNDAYRSRIRDPEKREKAVREFLQGAGLPPSLTQTYSFYTDQVYLSEQWSGAVVLQGRRNTIELSAIWQKNDPITTSAPVVPGVTGFNPFRQQGFTFIYSYQLSAFSSVTVGAGRLYAKTTDTSATAQAKSIQDTVRLGLTHQLGQKTDGSIGLRWVNFESAGSSSLVGPPYQELAVLAAVAYTF